MKKLIFVLSILILFHNIILSQDTIYLSKDSLLHTKFKTLFDNDGISLIEKNDYKFDGYFVIKVKGNGVNFTENINSTLFFWVDSLNHLKDPSKYYWFYYLIHTSLVNWIQKTPKSRIASDKNIMDIYKFAEYYLLFNRIYSESCESYLYDEKNFLYTTIIASSDTFWETENGDVFVIYSTKFVTSVVRLKIPLLLEEGKSIENPRIFIPISSLESFNKISASQASINGLKQIQIRLEYY